MTESKDDDPMPCYYGKVIIVKNNGTIIFGHIWENSPSVNQTSNTGSGESTEEEEETESAQSSSTRSKRRKKAGKCRKRK
ncbi:hypothetical protein RB620_09700 [Paenibacillus sp. LHD-117]|uniref:hypothetical protein n=1 Tax=Paenibacillus sp. LHD-117 TaxID=3071412 RepID=UPI0027E14C3D|nr:hypothetical protein [Paenibacillus sp. LHD-117]MDQ6419703.1 hypothetical protein [Paenibacillus sp. LHD-117]